MISAPWYNDAIERTAFNAYACYESNYSRSDAELIEIANQLIDKFYSTGCVNFNLEGNDLTDEDIKFIQAYVDKHA